MKNTELHNPALKENKPLEIYIFVNPFCPECWALTPLIKKLQIEYGGYFTLKYVLCGQLATLNTSKKTNDLGNYSRWKSTAEQPAVFTPHLAAIAIKAAELQGKKAGIRFILRLQELLFIENADITDINILQQCARNAELDIDEFLRDMYSNSASKAFQCDLKIAAEMEVTEMPAMVFFNEHIEDEGIKITGLYSYAIYVQVLTEMLEGYPKPAELPPLEQFLSNNPIVGSYDLALIYDEPVQNVEKKMKKLQLQRKVQKLPAKNGVFWKYVKNSI